MKSQTGRLLATVWDKNLRGKKKGSQGLKVSSPWLIFVFCSAANSRRQRHEPWRGSSSLRGKMRCTSWRANCLVSTWASPPIEPKKSLHLSLPKLSRNREKVKSLWQFINLSDFLSCYEQALAREGLTLDLFHSSRVTCSIWDSVTQNAADSTGCKKIRHTTWGAEDRHQIGNHWQ